MIKIDNCSPEEVKKVQKISYENKEYLGFIMPAVFTQAQKDNTLLVMKYEDEVIGFCLFNYRKKKRSTFISQICMVNEWRGNNLGKMFLDYLPRPIVLWCDTKNFSNRFYEKNGFKLILVKDFGDHKRNQWFLGEATTKQKKLFDY